MGLHDNNQKQLLLEHVRDMTVGKAYRFCRRSGLAPWCSLRYALLRA